MADLDFDNDKTALLVCDMQNDQVGAVTKAGQIRNIIENNQKAIAGARQAGIPVMYVVANFRAGYPEAHPNNRFQQANKAAGRLLEGSQMAAVNDAVAPEDGDIIIRKRRVNAFYATDLDIVLKAQGIETIVLTGIADGGVILSTTRYASDADYKIIILEDCTADRSAESHEFLCGTIFPRQADVGSVDDFLKIAGG